MIYFPFFFSTTRIPSIPYDRVWPFSSFSADLTMSQMVRSATETPVRASISTPVLPVDFALTTASINPSPSLKSTAIAPSLDGVAHRDYPGRLFYREGGSHPGRGKHVSLDNDPLTDHREGGRPKVDFPVATASRTTSDFALISTICALPSEIWVNFTIMYAS